MGNDENAATEIDLGRVVNTLPALVWTTHGDGRSDFVNRCWCEYTGLGPDEALNHGWQGAIHPDDLTSFLDCWSAIRQSGIAKEIDGGCGASMVNMLVRVPPVLHAGGSGRGRWCWLGLSVDGDARLTGVLRRFFDMLPWQAGFLNSAGVSEFSTTVPQGLQHDPGGVGAMEIVRDHPRR